MNMLDQLTAAVNAAHQARLARHMEGFKPTNPENEAQTLHERVEFMIESLPEDRRDAFKARLMADWGLD